MRTHSFIQLITLSFAKTEALLFKPFVFKRWLKWIGVAILAGYMTVGFNAFDLMQFPKTIQEATSTQSVDKVKDNPSDKTDIKNDSQTRIQETKKKEPAPKPLTGKQVWEDINKQGIWVLVLIGIIIFLSIGLIIWLCWVGAVSEFVWLRFIMYPDSTFRESFAVNKPQGTDLFKFYLLSGILGALFIFFSVLVVIAIAALMTEGTKFLGGQWWLPAFIGVLALSAFIVWFGVVMGVYVRQFMVTIMALDNIPFSEAWQRFWTIYRQSSRDFWCYFVSLILIEMVIGILCSIGVIISVLLMMLVAGIIIGSLYLVLMAFLKMKILFIICAIIAAVPLIVLMFILVFMVILPFATFRRCYSLYFLNSLNVGYRPLPMEG